MPNSPFDPTPQATPQEGPDNTGGTDVGGLADKWRGWVAKPSNRAALMQFGVAMLQPIQQGETGSSRFANALGSGGEASERVTNQAQKEKASEDTSQLRESNANLASERASHVGQTAELRAQNAGAVLDLKRQGLQMQQDRLQNVQQQGQTLNSIRLSNAYQNYVRDTTKQNSDPLNESPQPVMDFDTWQQANGVKPAAGAAVGAPMAGGQGTKPPLNTLIQKNPAAWNQIKTLAMQKDPRGLKALDDLRNAVADPQMVDQLLKGP